MGWQQGAQCVASYRFILELDRLYFGFDCAGRFLLSNWKKKGGQNTFLNERGKEKHDEKYSYSNRSNDAIYE